MAETEDNEKTAEELEEEESKGADESRAELDDAVGPLEREMEPLQEGETIDSPLGALPTRSLVAMGLMVAVSVAVFFIAWGVFGTAGLVLGWLPAAALGLLAAREYGRRKASS